MSLNNLIDQLRGPQGAALEPPRQPDAERLKALSTQFESMLVAQMLQQMRASMFEDGEEGEDAGLNNGPLSDALFAELSLAICRAGGLGLADSMLAPLQRQSASRSLVGPPDGVPALSSGETAVPAVAADAVSTATLGPLASGRVTSAYGWRRDPIDDSVKFHRGLDIALPVGQDVPAPQAGKVIFAGAQTGYGLAVVIEHANQLTTKYAHLSAIDVKVGDDVASGQVFAKSGATGRTTGPHLHVEAMEAGRSVNPAEVLDTYTGGRPQIRN